MTDTERLMSAADWAQRIDRAEASDKDIEAWLRWCEACADNRGAFEQMQALYQRLRGVPAEYRAELRGDFPDAFSPAPANRFRFRRLSLAAAVLVTVAGGLLGYWTLHREPAASTLYTTARGEHRAVTLSDGSKVVLGGASSVEVSYAEARRLLDIRGGEAYFEVKRDPARPFVVQAGTVRITAVGTAFNVEHGSHRVTIAVTEGAVNVSAEQKSSEPPLRLSMGQRTVVPLSDRKDEAPLVAPATVDTIDPAAAVAWQSGQLQFAGEPLSAVIESVNRYSQQPVAIGDATVGELKFTGTVMRERVEEWIVNLPHIFPLRSVSLEDGTVVLLAK